MSDLFQYNFADLGDVRLHYVTLGKGKPIVLLHGWPQTWYCWRHVMPLLAERYFVVAPDLRGLGDSSRPVSGYDKKTMANDIWRLMSEVLGMPDFFLVGHDWGGPTAFSLAAQRRKNIIRLVNFDTPVPGDGTDVMYANRWHHGLHNELDFPEALVAGREDIYLEFFFRNWGHRPDAISQEAVAEYLRTYRQPGAMRAGFNLYRAEYQDAADNEAFLAEGKLDLPVLCFAGPGGRGRGPIALESWRRVANNVEGGVIEDCGHWVPEEKPEWAAQQILAFFDKQS